MADGTTGNAQYFSNLEREVVQLREERDEANALAWCLLRMMPTEARITSAALDRAFMLGGGYAHIPADMLNHALDCGGSYVRHLDDNAGILFFPIESETSDPPEDWDRSKHTGASEDLSPDVEF